jgi:hypothetical protein
LRLWKILKKPRKNTKKNAWDIAHFKNVNYLALEFKSPLVITPSTARSSEASFQESQIRFEKLVFNPYKLKKMKTFVPVKALAIISALTIASIAGFSQVVTEFVFKNPVLQPGAAALQDGAKYKFANVASGIDAIIEIKGRSASNVVIKNIDVTSTGFDKAFQPQLGIEGSVAANKDWWVEFELTFYVAGTNQKKMISQFQATSLDTDGDDVSLREYIVMQKINSVMYSNITSLTETVLTNLPVDLNLTGDNALGIDKQITGPIKQYNNIDTNATDVMATYTFINKDVIKFRYGGKTGNTGVSSAVRLNSLWFKSFSTLPVNLVDFTARYSKPSVTLNWSTANETGFSHFEMERSVDGTNFSTLGVVFANGVAGNDLAKYMFRDNVSALKVPTVYYRLKMVDQSGAFRYSDVRIIRLETPQQQTIAISTYPNPATTEIRVTVPENWQNSKVEYSIYNLNGQQVKSTASNGTQTQAINVSNLAEGTYFIKVTNGAETATQKFIKSK